MNELPTRCQHHHTTGGPDQLRSNHDAKEKDGRKSSIRHVLLLDSGRTKRTSNVHESEEVVRHRMLTNNSSSRIHQNQCINESEAMPSTLGSNMVIPKEHPNSLHAKRSGTLAREHSLFASAKLAKHPISSSRTQPASLQCSSDTSNNMPGGSNGLEAGNDEPMKQAADFSAPTLTAKFSLSSSSNELDINHMVSKNRSINGRMCINASAGSPPDLAQTSESCGGRGGDPSKQPYIASKVDIEKSNMYSTVNVISNNVTSGEMPTRNYGAFGLGTGHAHTENSNIKPTSYLSHSLFDSSREHNRFGSTAASDKRGDQPNRPSGSHMAEITTQHPQTSAFIGSNSMLNPSMNPFMSYPGFGSLPAFSAPRWTFNMMPSYMQLMPVVIAPMHMVALPGSGPTQHGRFPPQVNINSLHAPPTAPMTESHHHPADNPLYISKECCNHKLRPAEIPRDPLDDEWENSTQLEKEIAWLVEESEVFLPSRTNDASGSKSLLPIALGFAWRHGSARLRELMWETFPSNISSMVKNLNSIECDTVVDSDSALTFVNGWDLLRSCHQSGSEKFDGIRKEAGKALRLGYRRSEYIEREINAINGLRWRDAVEEVGELSDVNKCVPSKLRQPRHQRKRRKNAALLQTALGQYHDSSLRSPSDIDAETIASNIPPELNPLEEEVAWLVEESLILLPDGMIDKKISSSDPVNLKQTESAISAGLVTKSTEINWDYVTINASELIKDKLKTIASIKRRPLQRIIRMSRPQVRIAFQKRRDEIASLLLIRGYRREITKLVLPSHELLVHTGLDQVWAVRLMRRRQNETLEEQASFHDLRSACNARLGDKEPATCARRLNKRKKLNPRVIEAPKKKDTVKVAVTHEAKSSVLNAEEEEIAWLREEYALETGNKCYDWDYIEHASSLPLLVDLAEKRCAPSNFPSVAGISKLKTMVRLSNPIVKDAFERKRVDIRYALLKRGFRRDRSKHLPNISPAPSTFEPPVIRKNGTSVIDIEYALSKSDDVGVEVIYIDDDSDDEVAGNNGLSQDGNYLKKIDSGANASVNKENEIICIDVASDNEIVEGQYENNGPSLSRDSNDLKHCNSANNELGNNLHCEPNNASNQTCITSLPLDDNDHAEDRSGAKREQENVSLVISARSDSPESLSESDEECESEAIDEDDDEYVASYDELEDDDLIEDFV